MEGFRVVICVAKASDSIMNACHAGARPAHELMKKLFTLAPYLQAKVERTRREFGARAMIGLQIRQARWCGKLTLAGDMGGRTPTNAYMTAEHHALFYACAKSLLRERRGQAGKSARLNPRAWLLAPLASRLPLCPRRLGPSTSAACC